MISLSYFRSQMNQISVSLAVQPTFASTNEQLDDNDTSIKRAKIYAPQKRWILQTFVWGQFVQLNNTNA